MAAKNSQNKKKLKTLFRKYSYLKGRGGLMVSVFATRSARPGFESRPGASLQSGQRGGRSLCGYCTNELIKLEKKVKKIMFDIQVMLKILWHCSFSITLFKLEKRRKKGIFKI